jgi:mannosyltransferase
MPLPSESVNDSARDAGARMQSNPAVPSEGNQSATSSVGRISQTSWFTALALIAISGIATGLRLYMLGARSLWLDEGMSVGFARLPWPEFTELLWQREGNMSLYYVLLRWWLSVGDSEARIRGLSVIASVGAVIAIYFLGKRLFNRNTGLLAAFVLALNVFHILYAQEARSYAFLSLAVILASYCLVRAVESGSAWMWSLYAAFSAAAMYFHFFAAFVVAAQALSVILWLRPIPWKNLIISLTICGIFVLPIGAFMHANFHNSQLDWVHFPTWHVFYSFLNLFTGNGGSVLVWGSVLLVGAGIALFVIQYKKKTDSREVFSLGFVVVWLFFPLVAMLGISIHRPIFVDRYMTISLPAFALILARVLESMSPKLRVAAFALFVVLSARGVNHYYKTPTDDSEDWRSAAQYYLSHSQPGEMVMFNNGSARAVFEYYIIRDTGSPSRDVMFPAHGDKMTMLDFGGIPNLKFVKFKTKGVNRIWAIDWFLSKPCAAYLGDAYHQGESGHFLKVDVSLFTRTSTN